MSNPRPDPYRPPNRRDLAQLGERERQARTELSDTHTADAGDALPVRHLKLVAEHDDHLVCKEWDGEQTFGADVLVAKPPSLRGSTGSYEAGEDIWAAPTVYTGVDVDDAGLTTLEVRSSSGLPAPGTEYMVLQLLDVDGTLTPSWDWVRAHA